jgi:p-hydroxybenzoate 3-monooxygenase
MTHPSVAFIHRNALRKIDLRELTGECITIYGQQEIIKNLIACRYANSGDIYFGAQDVRIHDVTGQNPSVTFSLCGVDQQISCSWAASFLSGRGAYRPAICSQGTEYGG